eukprot:723862-Pleurochrysis_carterae.AAC.1
MRRSTPPRITAKAWLMACGDNPESNMTLSVPLLWIQTEDYPCTGGRGDDPDSQLAKSQTLAQEYAPQQHGDRRFLRLLRQPCDRDYASQLGVLGQRDLDVGVE